MPRKKPARWANGRNDDVLDLWRGCVGYWPMWMGAGLTAYDLSPYHNHGTLTTLGWVPTQVGQALIFDGNTDSISLGNPSHLDGLPAITVSMLVYFDASVHDYDLLVKGDHDAGQPFLFWADESTGDHYACLITDSGATGSGIKYSAAVPILGAWQHLCVTFANEQIRMFINGVEDDNSPFATPGVSDIASGGANGGIWVIGKDPGSITRTLDGKIALTTIHNRALSAGEIAYLAANPFIMIRQPDFTPFWDVVGSAVGHPYCYRYMDRVRGHAS